MHLLQHNKPIFIHAGWRTCGTYFWKKFRSNAIYKSYYEPFHEDLLYLDLNIAKSRFGDTFLKSLNHPTDIDKFYYYEYNMKNGMKIPKFKKRLIFEDMDADNSPNMDYTVMKDYIQYLINESEKDNKIPVMKFSRSYFRMNWLKNNFDSINIGVIRNSRDQWNSYMKTNKDYFNTMTFLTILYCDKEFEELQDLIKIDLDRYNTDFFKFKDEITYRIVHNMSNRELYYYFYYVRKKAIKKILDNCDFVFRSDKLEEMRTSYEESLKKVFNIEIDLSDFKYSKTDNHYLNENEMKDIELEIDEKIGN